VASTSPPTYTARFALDTEDVAANGFTSITDAQLIADAQAAATSREGGGAIAVVGVDRSEILAAPGSYPVTFTTDGGESVTVRCTVTGGPLTPAPSPVSPLAPATASSSAASIPQTADGLPTGVVEVLSLATTCLVVGPCLKNRTPTGLAVR
jgi:hypothetical protein